MSALKSCEVDFNNPPPVAQMVVSVNDVPADRLRQCIFAGTTNRQDFLPRDRTGNRRFIPIPVDAELAEVHILDNEEESRAYIDQLWAEAMTIYNSGNYKLAFNPAMQENLQAHQQDFMQEDAQAGMIYAFLEDYTGDQVCSKQLYAEALGNTNIPAEWETRAICEDVYKRQALTPVREGVVDLIGVELFQSVLVGSLHGLAD